TGVNNTDSIPVSQIQKWNEEPFMDYLGKTDNVKPFIENAHCIILPSFYREGTPRSILEGLAIGRPIITTDMPGCRTTVINGENGYLVPPNEINILSEKMQEIMNQNFELLQKMGKRSRQLAEEQFDENIVINKYLDDIRNLLIK
ncbi:MAG: glycosyltransferase, partial [Ignavibacterium sp.]|nr:glycosyltransferase [Ignavibacterium sp.]